MYEIGLGPESETCFLCLIRKLEVLQMIIGQQDRQKIATSLIFGFKMKGFWPPKRRTGTQNDLVRNNRDSYRSPQRESSSEQQFHWMPLNATDSLVLWESYGILQNDWLNELRTLYPWPLFLIAPWAASPGFVPACEQKVELNDPGHSTAGKWDTPQWHHWECRVTGCNWGNYLQLSSAIQIIQLPALVFMETWNETAMNQLPLAPTSLPSGLGLPCHLRNCSTPANARIQESLGSTCHTKSMRFATKGPWHNKRKTLQNC